jgi:hypothetical protein
MYTAIYLPSRQKGVEDPSKDGFTTEKEAEEYIFTHMCSACQTERADALAGKHKIDENYPPSKYPGCFYEWIIGPTEKIESAENYNDLMLACGWETVYNKNNSPEENEFLRTKYLKKEEK